MTSPCKGCKQRILNCHSTCESYKGFRKAVDEVKELKYKSRLYPFAHKILHRRNGMWSTHKHRQHYLDK